MARIFAEWPNFRPVAPRNRDIFISPEIGSTLDIAWNANTSPTRNPICSLTNLFPESKALVSFGLGKNFRNANHFKLRKEKNSFCINSFLHKIGLEWAGYLWLIFKKLKWSWIGENKQWKIYVFESIVFVKASPFSSFQRCDLWFMESPTYLNVFTVQVFVLHLCRYSAKIDPFQSNWIKRQMQLQKWCWPQPRFLNVFWDS